MYKMYKKGSLMHATVACMKQLEYALSGLTHKLNSNNNLSHWYSMLQMGLDAVTHKTWNLVYKLWVWVLSAVYCSHQIGYC